MLRRSCTLIVLRQRQRQLLVRASEVEYVAARFRVLRILHGQRVHTVVQLVASAPLTARTLLHCLVQPPDGIPKLALTRKKFYDERTFSYHLFASSKSLDPPTPTSNT